MTKRILLSLIPLTGCITGDSPPPDPETPAAGVRGAPIVIERSPALDEIRQLEDERWDGGGRLFELARSDHPRVRAEAVRALGRLPYPRFGVGMTRALCQALEDPDPAVRRRAAFALGLRGDPSCADPLLAALRTPDPLLRALLVEAAGRFGDEEWLRIEVLSALEDPDARVRYKAAVATALWDPGAEDAARVNRELVDVLIPFSMRRNQRSKDAEEAEFVWRVLFSLSRRSAEEGRGAFLEYADSRNPLEQLFALRGLGRLEPDETVVDAALDALVETDDWRCAYEAIVALGRFGDPRAIPVLKRTVEDVSAHVRAATVEALAAFPESRDEIVPILQRGSLDLSAAVRAAALRARVRLHDLDDAVEILERRSRDEDPIVRLAVARIAGEIEAKPDWVFSLLRRMAEDPSLLVATRAIESLGSHLNEPVRAYLHELLSAADNGKRLAAVMALRRGPDPGDLKPLERAYVSSTGDISSEIAFNVLENLGALGGRDAESFLREKVSDPRPYVAQVAREVLADSYGVEVELSKGLPPVSRNPVPRAGLDYPAYTTDPIVEIVTSRGPMIFELLPAEAPLHVHNFLTLVRRDHYRGTTFHRVVPDFVIQGGDVRGDGNGATPWRGSSLRNEFTPRTYQRGCLGMPRHADPDSGGSQFFVTHRPTPHLDGRYTIFGLLRSGGDVLDRIEIGDTILEVRVLP